MDYMRGQQNKSKKDKIGFMRVSKFNRSEEDKIS